MSDRPDDAGDDEDFREDRFNGPMQVYFYDDDDEQQQDAKPATNDKLFDKIRSILRR